MKRQFLIVLSGCAVVAWLIVANLRIGSFELVKASSEEMYASERRVIPEIEVQPLHSRSMKAAKGSGRERKMDADRSGAEDTLFTSGEAIRQQARLVAEKFKRSSRASADEAAKLFYHSDMESYVIRRDQGRVGGGVSASDDSDDGMEEVARAFVLWTQTDPDTATEWAEAQNLQPVMTSLLRESAPVAVSDGREASIQWIDQIQSADLKEVAAWSFTEEWVRQEPEAGISFLEDSNWLGAHEKIRVQTLAQHQ